MWKKELNKMNGKNFCMGGILIFAYSFKNNPPSKNINGLTQKKIQPKPTATKIRP